MSSSERVGTWDRIWEDIFRSRDWGKYPPEHVVRFIARTFYNTTDRNRIRLLEIGCGPGANIWFMAREGFSVYGIDGSATAIHHAKERLTKEGLRADLQIGDYSHLPWADSTFDGVVENVSLYSNPSAGIEQALKEVHRVLRPGGHFLSSFFSDHTWGYGKGEMTEEDGFMNIAEGPLAESGFGLFLRRNRVPEVFHHFTDLTVERISWTLHSEQHLIEQLVIVCRKEIL